MCANYDLLANSGYGGGDKMGKGLKGSAEMSTCAMIPLVPARKNTLAPTPSESGWRRHDESESKKDVPNTKVEEYKATAAIGGHKGTMDLKAAKEAVVFMGFPDNLVQLVIDMEHLDPSLRFTNAKELYERVEALANHPKRQADLFMKFHQHRQASSTSSTNVGEPGRGRQAPAVLTSNAENDRQTPPTGMSEGTCQSATAAVTSSSTETSSSVTASLSGHGASEMVRALNASSEEASETTSARDLDQNPHQGAASGAAKTSSTEQLRSRVRKLAEENWRLTQRKLCRACKTVELSSSGVTFLPCGHFVTCEACSEKFDNCPACGRVIMGTVRTFLS